MEGGGVGHNMKRRTGISGVLSHHDHDPSHLHTNLDSDDFTHSALADTMERKGSMVLSPMRKKLGSHI